MFQVQAFKQFKHGLKEYKQSIKKLPEAKMLKTKKLKITSLSSMLHQQQ